MSFHPNILGLLIIPIYVYFQEFVSIFKDILLQIRKENGEKVQTFTISIGSRIASDCRIWLWIRKRQDRPVLRLTI